MEGEGRGWKRRGEGKDGRGEKKKEREGREGKGLVQF